MAAAESSVSCSSVVSAEELTCALSKLGKSELILKEECWLYFLCSLGEIFLYGCQRGIREEYLFLIASVQLWKTKRVFFYCVSCCTT